MAFTVSKLFWAIWNGEILWRKCWNAQQLPGEKSRCQRKASITMTGTHTKISEAKQNQSRQPKLNTEVSKMLKANHLYATPHTNKYQSLDSANARIGFGKYENTVILLARLVSHQYHYKWKNNRTSFRILVANYSSYMCTQAILPHAALSNSWTD